MTSQSYDLTISDHLNSSSSPSSISHLSDKQVISLYKKKIQRKKDPNARSESSTRYKVSRDYEVVLEKEKGLRQFGRGKRLFAVLGFQKIQEFFRNTLWSIREQTICVDDIRLPIDPKKAEQGLQSIDDVWKRRVQLLIVSGFMKISFEQKEVIRKRQQLECQLKTMRIQHVFSILKDFTVMKRTKGVQADLVPDQSVIQKIDSSATMHDSFLSKNKARTFRNPFSKFKDQKDGVSMKLDESKISEPTSLHTINLKMSKLENVLNEARKIRESHQLTKRYSVKLAGIEDGEQDGLMDEQVHRSCLEIKGGFIDNWREREYQRQNEQKELAKLYNKRSDTQTFKNTIFNPSSPKQPYSNINKTKRFKSVTGKNEPTRNQSKSRTVIHQIIQPVIQQIIQPIHYHHISYDSYASGYHNYYQNTSKSSRLSQPELVTEREYIPSGNFGRSRQFSRVYSGTPQYKNRIWS